MADLGNLWFSLGLDDSKFEKEWQKAFQKYEKQANINVGIQIQKADLTNLNSIKKQLDAFSKGFNNNTKAKIDIEVTPNTIAALKSLKDLGGTKADWVAVKEAVKAMKESVRAVNQLSSEQNRASNKNLGNQKKITSEYQKQALWVQNLTTLASNYFSLYSVKNFVTELANISGEFEKQRVTLQAMVGEMEGLDIFSKIKKLSVVSPFEFKDLASYTKQLAAFSVPYEELYDTTKRLADVSAGLGVDMSRIILAFGQIRSAGVLKGTELRQLTEAGVPILEKLAKKFTELEGQAVSVGDVFGKISKKMVSFEMVKDIFTELTSEGGKFYNMQEIQAETLSGKIANLKDAYAIMLSEIGESSDDWLKNKVDFLYKAISNWEILGRTIFTVFNIFGAYQAVKVLQWLSSQAVAITKLDFAFKRLYVSARQSHNAIVSFLKAFAQSKGIAAVAAIIAALAGTIIQTTKAAREFNKELNNIINAETSKLNDEVESLNRLSNAIYSAAEGTEKRREAINKFNSRFGDYLDNLHSEIATNNEIEASQGRILTAIQNRYREEALLRAKNKVDEKYGEGMTNIEANMKAALKKAGFSDVGYIVDDIRKIVKSIPKNATIGTIVDELKKKGYSDDDAKGIRNALTKRMEGSLDSVISNYKDAVKDYYEELDKANERVLDEMKVSTFSTKEIEDAYNKYTDEYRNAIEKIKDNAKLTKQEVDSKVKQEEIKYYTRLTELFKDLPLTVQQYKDKLEELTKVEKEWRVEIAKITASFNTDKIKIPTLFNPKENETWLQYVDRIKQEYKEIVENISNIGADPDKELPTLEKFKSAIEAVADAYKIILDPKGAKKTADEEEKARIKALKEEYQWVMQVYEAYKKYREQGLSESDAKKSILADFVDLPESISAVLKDEHIIPDWFEEELRSLAAVAAKNGSDIGESLEHSILLNLSKVKFNEVTERLRLKEQIEEALKGWGLEDFALFGKGMELDISKILRDQAIANNKVADKRDQLLKDTEKLREQLGEEWYKKEKERIKNLYNLEISNNEKIAEAKIAELAKAGAEEVMKKVGVSKDFMSSISDKSIKQLEEARAKLMAASVGKIDISPEIKEQAEKLGVALKPLINAIKAYLTGFEFDIASESTERAKKNLSDSLNAAKQIVGAFKGLAKEDSFFAGLLDSLDLALGMTSSLVSAFDKKEGGGLKLTNPADLINAIAQVTTFIINQIVAAKQYREEMEAAARSFQDTIVLSRRELAIAGEEFQTIFGENIIGALEADSKAIQDIITQLRGVSREVANMEIVEKKGFLGMGKKKTTLKDLAPQLFNANGTVNYKYLDAFLDAYGDKMDDAQKSMLDNLLSTYEQYENAMSDITDHLSDIFSDTASTIADRMMESFAATGSAVTELEDLVNDVAKQMAKDLIQSLMVEQYLAPAIKRVENLYNPDSVEYEQDASIRIEKSILALQDGLLAAQGGAEEVNKILQGLANMGIDFSADTENASQVLSGLTEDQQNLLMGYINGIRADVSYNKGLLLNVVNSVGTINNNIATAIVVWKQIEANTHRSADGVDKIIGYFESVTGPYDGGGGQAFRVNIA